MQQQQQQQQQQYCVSSNAVLLLYHMQLALRAERIPVTHKVCVAGMSWLSMQEVDSIRTFTVRLRQTGVQMIISHHIHHHYL
jgi:hypothetical protein